LPAPLSTHIRVLYYLSYIIKYIILLCRPLLYSRRQAYANKIKYFHYILSSNVQQCPYYIIATYILIATIYYTVGIYTIYVNKIQSHCNFKPFKFFMCYSGNLLRNNKNYDEAILSYRSAINFRPTLACKYNLM